MVGEGKDDAIDAERAARDVLSGKWTSVPKARGGWVEDVRSLCVARERCVKSRVESLAAARSHTATAPEGQRRRWEGMSANALMSSLPGLGGGGATAPERSPPSLARQWDLARGEADELEGLMRDMLERGCPAVLAICCCGTVNAADLVVSAARTRRGSARRRGSPSTAASRRYRRRAAGPRAG